MPLHAAYPHMKRDAITNRINATWMGPGKSVRQDIVCVKAIWKILVLPPRRAKAICIRAQDEKDKRIVSKRAKRHLPSMDADGLPTGPAHLPDTWPQADGRLGPSCP